MNPSGMRLELGVERSSSRGDIGVVGEFDRLNIEHFDRVSAGLTSVLREFVVDLRRTTIIDSAALGSLVRLRHALDDVNCSMTVIVSKPFQETVMRVGGLFDYLGVVVDNDPNTGTS